MSGGFCLEEFLSVGICLGVFCPRTDDSFTKSIEDKHALTIFIQLYEEQAEQADQHPICPRIGLPKSCR